MTPATTVTDVDQHAQKHYGILWKFNGLVYVGLLRWYLSTEVAQLLLTLLGTNLLQTGVEVPRLPLRKKGSRTLRCSLWRCVVRAAVLLTSGPRSLWGPVAHEQHTSSPTPHG